MGIISTVAGIFGSCLKDAYAFEFGSSRGSKDKDQHIYYQALLEKNEDYEGIFYVGVKARVFFVGPRVQLGNLNLKIATFLKRCRKHFSRPIVRASAVVPFPLRTNLRKPFKR